MKVGILTGGGDCPGLNPAIRAVVKKSVKSGYEVVGIRDGWKGLIELNYKNLSSETASGILHLGGTILGTSRTNPFATADGPQKVIENIHRIGLDALVAIGGDDTLGVAYKLYGKGVNTIGIPKTIDNDLSATDFTFGFDSAVNIVMDALDNLHSTAESHHRVLVVEVMGRHAGWIATYGGLAGGADYILIPEKPFTIDEVCSSIKRRHSVGKTFSIIVVAEGAVLAEAEKIVTKDARKDAFGHAMLGGVGKFLCEEIEKKTGYECRDVVLGHLQRGGSPTAFDRILATRYGIAAVELIQKKDFGKMVALRGNQIVAVSLEEGVTRTKTIDMDIYEIASTFFG
ncbi:MAG: ATP-dependent 6-phosphofructokinase [Nitrospirota bacterium]|nr:ATP-dependent 6-phosphofructokinase [Nitrospirota bacterium]